MSEIERAWETLIASGIITQEDKALLEQRRRDRELLGLASKVLAEASKAAGDIISVIIVTERWAYAADKGEPPKILPRVTSSRQRKGKANEANTDKPEAGKPEANGDEAEIPTEALKQASQALGVQWYGRANALRSKRVIALAKEIAGQKA